MHINGQSPLPNGTLDCPIAGMRTCLVSAQIVYTVSMTRPTVLIVLLTLLLSPVLDALAHGNVIDSVSPTRTAVTEVLNSGCSKTTGTARDAWHAAMHCVTHMSAHVERMATVAHIEYAIRTLYVAPSTSIDIGRNLRPPVPPPLA